VGGDFCFGVRPIRSKLQTQAEVELKLWAANCVGGECGSGRENYANSCRLAQILQPKSDFRGAVAGNKNPGKLCKFGQAT
jgi:hypothetical protein